MLSPLLFNIFSAAVIHAVLERFSEDPEIVRDLAHLEEDLEEDRVEANADPTTCVRRAVWGMLYADDAGIVSKSAEGFVKMMTVIVTVSKQQAAPVREKDGDHAAADARPGSQDLTARHRSSRPEV